MQIFYSAFFVRPQRTVQRLIILLHRLFLLLIRKKSNRSRAFSQRT